MRLDGVEVKVSLDSSETARAVGMLHLPDVEPWQIMFVEDVVTGLTSSTPLLDQGLIIRARQKTSGKDDVTVKLRPARRTQLPAPWLQLPEESDTEHDTEFKVEQDWAGTRRTLSISLNAERPDGLIAAAADNRDVASLLTGDQKRFIEECAEGRINLEVLSMLPALSAMRWPTFSIPGPNGSELKVRAERWTVYTLDFLELSLAVKADEAEVSEAVASQRALEAFVDAKGLRLADGEPKTSQVLAALVAQAAATMS